MPVNHSHLSCYYCKEQLLLSGYRAGLYCQTTCLGSSSTVTYVSQEGHHGKISPMHPKSLTLYEYTVPRASLSGHYHRFWHAIQDCVAPYVDHILYRDRFWAVSIASGSVRL